MDNYLQHHGVKGMKWGRRKQYKYANKASYYRNVAEDYDPKGYSTPLSAKQTARYTNKMNKANAKAAKYQAKADNYNNGTQTTQRKGLTANQKKALKIGSAVAGTMLVAYGTHKVLNDPRAIKAGRQAIDSMMSVNANMKTSVTSSTEYKIAKAVGNGAKKYGGAIVNTVGNEKVGKFVTGVGAMAGTAALLRTQVKDLKSIKTGDGDNIDKTLNTIKKTSEIGESVNSLAKGPMGQTGSAKSSGSSSNKSGNGSLAKNRDISSKVGEPKGFSGPDSDKQYNALFKKNPSEDQRNLIKGMRKQGYSVDQIEEYVFHNDEKFKYTHDDKGNVKSISGTLNIKHYGERYANIYFGV